MNGKTGCPNREEESNIVEIVNRLIRESFGNKWKGNYNDWGNYNTEGWGMTLLWK